ncbi:hypothetical protein C8Q73DRAFT_400497 [Cubamyces lactineus]|nr:hypothetical protein C8Q73DRAFT_400497 [Cubamyces lactineus]
MPALSRAVLLGLKAAALVSLVGPPLAPSPALASPIPLPAPLMPHIADYAAQPPARTNATAMPQAESIMLGKRNNIVVVSHTAPERSSLASRYQDTDTNVMNNVNILGNMYNIMSDHSSELKQLAANPPAGGDPDFNQRVLTEFTGFQNSLSSVQSILAELGADRGLANYDPEDELETLLKNIVNTVKDTLKAVDNLVFQVPVLGPVLGPIVYQVKCILDETLDAVENLTDALLNALKPLLLDVIGQAVTAACSYGLQLESLCLVI